MIEPLGTPDLRFEEVTPERWADFESLFESKGGPKNCWCMVWRALPSGTRGDKAAKKQAIMQRILNSEPVGLLGYRGTESVAWCSVAPRDTYRPLGGIDDDETNVWSLVCMFVKREIRGAGVGNALIRAAADHARRRGADVLEAYPVDPDSPSYRFMGFVPMFETMGFETVGQSGSRRQVMRLVLK